MFPDIKVLIFLFFIIISFSLTKYFSFLVSYSPIVFMFARVFKYKTKYNH